jgi:hypothetical protein
LWILEAKPKRSPGLIFVSISSHQSGVATGAMLIPEQCWHRSNAGTGAMLAPEQFWHQEGAGTMKGVQGGKVLKNETGTEIVSQGRTQRGRLLVQSNS